jgi:hypothetical protein
VGADDKSWRLASVVRSVEMKLRSADSGLLAPGQVWLVIGALEHVDHVVAKPHGIPQTLEIEREFLDIDMPK